jgi:predicted  nucleic acid-binding Zn-ribbon protein
MQAPRNFYFFVVVTVPWLFGSGPAAAQKKDYLSTLEADKIRDAETTSERIKLFVSFAADRLKKFQYEIARPGTDRRRAERLNDLLNAYAGCLDDAAERIEEGLEKQEDIRSAVKELKNKAKEFLAYLEKLPAGGPEFHGIKQNLEDAIEATQDALKDAEKAEKEMAPPPVRRKP